MSEVVEPKVEENLADHPLCKIKGIGPKTAEKLIEKGINTMERVAIMRPEELADTIGITNKAAKDIVNDAKTQALDKAIKTSSLRDVIDHRKNVMQRIPSGSADFDMIMNGGIPTEATTIFKGEYASGKTQIAYQLAVNCIKYLKRKIIWIETEAGTFVPDRILEIAKASGVTIDIDNDFIVVTSVNIATPYAQFLAYERAEQDMLAKKMDVGLMVIDSFSSKFRSFFTGREMLPDRSKEEARHLGFLDTMCSKYNMAIVMSAQVMDIPDAGGQLGERVKSGHTKRIVGGNVVTHGGTYLISLQKMSMQEWEACIFDSPDIPMRTVRFKITPQGIRNSKGD